MFQDKRVVICIPSGRYRYMRILLPYLLADRFASIIDEIQLWVNTDEPADLAYFERLEATFPKVKRIFSPGPLKKELYDARRKHFQYSSSIHLFYAACVAPNTIYVKMDDDICYVHDEFFENLMPVVIERAPTNFACVTNVFNIPHITKILQDEGVIGDVLGHCTGDPRCPYACTNGEFAAYIHRQFLDILNAGNVKSLYFVNAELPIQHQRIGVMAWAGENFALFGGRVGPRDESDLTKGIPRALKRPLYLVGNALVSHFAFSHQRAVLEDQTDILTRYLRISIGLNGDIAA